MCTGKWLLFTPDMSLCVWFVRLVEEPIPPIQPQQVLLQFLAAPINPADLNMVSKQYPLRVYNKTWEIAYTQLRCAF
jgi:hypothetical protein